MHFLEHIAERKIAEAERQGALKDLPGEGAPLALDDDPLIPEDVLERIAGIDSEPNAGKGER